LEQVGRRRRIALMQQTLKNHMTHIFLMSSGSNIFIFNAALVFNYESKIEICLGQRQKPKFKKQNLKRK